VMHSRFVDTSFQVIQLVISRMAKSTIMTTDMLFY